MSLEKAKACLKEFNLESRIMEFDTSSATVKEAAEAIHCQEKDIAKSLSFLVGDKAILIVTAGDQKIDNAKFKAEYGVKAKMVPFEDVEHMIGHEVGGVCPFGVNEGIDIYLDVSLKRLEYVYPACGSHNSAVKLTIDELERTSHFLKWVDVCKSIE